MMDADKYSVMVPNSVAKALIETPGTTVATDLADEFGSPYELSDGRLVYWYPGAAKVVIYFSREHFAESQRLANASADSSHMLTNLIPQGADFIRAVPQLVEALPAILGVNRSSLDGSIASLTHIDQYAQGARVKHCLSPRIFPALVAYIGEVMRRCTNGHWELREQQDSVFEPWIQSPRGSYCPFSPLLDQLVEEDDETRSIQGAVQGRLGTW